MSDEEEAEFYRQYNVHVKMRGVTTTQSVEEFHRNSLPVARERWRVVGNYFSPGKRVLEVGSSTGAFLSLIEGCETSGAEMAEANAAFSAQFISDAVYGRVEEVPPGKQFDIICMFHVFEHIKAPVQFLKRCQTLLAPGGTVLIEVPHIDDPLISLYKLKEFKDFVFQPMHPMVYSVPSLRYVFTHSGLREQNVIYHQRYGLDNHLAWLKNRKQGRDDVLSELFADNEAYKRALQANKTTDTLFYIASAKGEADA